MPHPSSILMVFLSIGVLLNMALQLVTLAVILNRRAMREREEDKEVDGLRGYFSDLFPSGAIGQRRSTVSGARMPEVLPGTVYTSGYTYGSPVPGVGIHGVSHLGGAPDTGDTVSETQQVTTTAVA